MTKSITYTSKMDTALMDELTTYSKRLNKNKKELIEAALRNYFIQIKKLQYAESYKRANADAEIKEWADLGLDDYQQQLEKTEG
ncbi:MAG TPA: hypothetical protein PLF48_09370, partial [Chitinophagales bacterium]|nr:hypothetical protein [Chitinophagales bacterium]